MEYKKIFQVVLTLVFCVSSLFVCAQPAQAVTVELPSCVMLKFVNKTRFKKLAPEVKLSDLVMEKLVASGRFRLKETKPIDKNVEAQLYDENQRFAEASEAAKSGNFDKVFASSSEASTIDSAQIGQSVSPELTASIGREHGANYLIHGTILGIARGSEEDHKFNSAASLFGAIAGHFGGAWGDVVKDIAQDTKKTYTGTTLKSDMRIIKAETGEVVWHKEIICSSMQDKVQVGMISAGSSQLSMELYEKALDQAAQKIVDELITEMGKGKLFG